LKGQLFRKQVPPHHGYPEHGLDGYQIYPNGGNLSLDFFTQPPEQYPKLIDRTTPITSVGSCFAVEIRNHLRDAKFNFISTRESWAGSAEWGRVDTTKNLLQIFQYSFTDFVPEIRISHTPKGYFDPYRDGPMYSTEEAAERGLLEHYGESRQAFEACKVLIITPGQNEAWINKSDGLAWYRKPPPETFATYGEDRFCVKRFTLPENVENLTAVLELLWANNPEAQVIFTVSPVPSWATFYDTNVAVRSFENKAILLLAVKEVLSQYPGRAHYFPSFEMATLSHNWNLQLDNRHVRPKVVEGIMDCFDQRFLVDA
jgi:hypothetical protein